MIAWTSAAASLPTEATFPHVFKYYKWRIALIETTGTLYNGERDSDEGSGLLLGDDLVITDSHVIPRSADYETLTIDVHLGGRNNPPISAKLLRRDKSADLALLQLAVPQVVQNSVCPVESHALGASTPAGTSVVVLGYPSRGDLQITSGLRGSDDDEKPEWLTDATMNRGNSGGPVFDARGYVLGFAVRGVKWDGDGDSAIPVSGVNFFTTVATLMKSPLVEYIEEPPPCWQVSDEMPAPSLIVGAPTITERNAGAPHALIAAAALSHAPASLRADYSPLPLDGKPNGDFLDPARMRLRLQAAGVSATVSHEGITAMPSTLVASGVSPGQLPEKLNHDIPLSFKRDFHFLFTTSERFHREFAPDPDYKIASCNLTTLNVRNSSATCSVSADGGLATIDGSLTSGSIFEGGGGSWLGSITLVEVRLPQ